MRLNNLDFLETLKQDNQVCGGDNSSDVDVDVDIMIDGDVDIIDLDSTDLPDSEDISITVNEGWAEFGYYYPIY